jgi:hypothetical protein
MNIQTYIKLKKEHFNSPDAEKAFLIQFLEGIKELHYHSKTTSLFTPTNFPSTLSE